MEEKKTLYTGRVVLDGGVLNVRSEPGGSVIGTIENGAQVEVLGDEGEWLVIAYAQEAGCVAKRYVRFEGVTQNVQVVIEDEAGNTFLPGGGFAVRVVMGAID